MRTLLKGVKKGGFFIVVFLLIFALTASPAVAYAKPLNTRKGGALSPTQVLIDSPSGGAAAWSHTALRILINPNQYQTSSPEVSAGRRSIDSWKAYITWFSSKDWNGDGKPDHPWLNGFNFVVYVKGVNESLLAGIADVTITYRYEMVSRYILGYASLSYVRVGGHYAIRSADIFIGVRGLSSMGIENVLAHEFGHALGLDHSNSRGDLMYASFDAERENRFIAPPSTLNLYALALSHGWLSRGVFSEYRGELAITLPASHGAVTSGVAGQWIE